MALRVESKAHSGEEWYEVTLVYTDEQLAQVARMTEVGQIVTETVVLVWTRHVGGPWQRYTRGRSGSRAEGCIKLGYPADGARGVRRAREIFDPTRNNETRKWAQYLPGLINAVQDAEAGLPR
jgi:hypothetical protein